MARQNCSRLIDNIADATTHTEPITGQGMKTIAIKEKMEYISTSVRGHSLWTFVYLCFKKVTGTLLFLLLHNIMKNKPYHMMRTMIGKTGQLEWEVFLCSIGDWEKQI